MTYIVKDKDGKVLFETKSKSEAEGAQFMREGSVIQEVREKGDKRLTQSSVAN